MLSPPRRRHPTLFSPPTSPLTHSLPLLPHPNLHPRILPHVNTDDNGPKAKRLVALLRGERDE